MTFGLRFSSCNLLVHVRVPEHLIGVYGGQPEAVGVAVVVARPPAVALDEGSAAELFQAGTGGGQGLTGALSTGTGVLGRGGDNKSVYSINNCCWGFF